MKKHAECNDCVADKLYDFLKAEKGYIKNYNEKCLFYNDNVELWVIPNEDGKNLFETEFLDLAIEKLMED